MFLTLICLHIGPWHWHHKTKTSSILIPISFLQTVLKKDKKKKKKSEIELKSEFFQVFRPQSWSYVFVIYWLTSVLITIRLILQIICLFTISCSVLMYWHFTFRTARVRPLDRWNETSDVVCAVTNLLWRTGSNASVSVSSTLSFPRPLHDVASIVRLNSKCQSFFGYFFFFSSVFFTSSYKPEIILIIYNSNLFGGIYIIRVNGVRKDIFVKLTTEKPHSGASIWPKWISYSVPSYHLHHFW